MLNLKIPKSALVIVAHPDDETLWAGGTILSHESWTWFIVCLCRKNDPDRAPKFIQALAVYQSAGVIGDLDDSQEQAPLSRMEVEQAILDLLPAARFDLLFSHNPNGEYTKHIRHEETGRAVINLWHAGKIKANQLLLFAYEDGCRAYFPKAISNANVYHLLKKKIWSRKHKIMTEIYGFAEDSWESQTTPRSESFWQFTQPDDAIQWVNQSDQIKKTSNCL